VPFLEIGSVREASDQEGAVKGMSPGSFLASETYGVVADKVNKGL
jgi:hypothetical protein